MRILKILIISTLFLFTACRKENSIIVKKINRNITNNEVIVELENLSNKNFYVLSPQCQIEGNGYYFHGKLDSLDYFKSALLDKSVFEIYKSERISIPLILISAKSVKKLNFKYYKNIAEYPKTTLYFPFNIKHDKLKAFSNKLKEEKIIPAYDFYSGTVSNSN